MWAFLLNSAGGSNFRCSFRMESMLGLRISVLFGSTTALSAMMRTSTRRSFAQEIAMSNRADYFTHER